MEGISKSYGETPVLIDLDLEARADQLTVVYGPPASGKSVLVRILTGLEKPDQGRILLRGEDVTSEAPAERNIGYVWVPIGLSGPGIPLEIEAPDGGRWPARTAAIPFLDPRKDVPKS